jgi:antitoxin ChpS
MLKTNLRKVGGSIMLAVPPVILDLLHLQAGATVNLSVDHGCLVVEPTTKRRRYTLEELLAECDPSAEISIEDGNWLDSKPVGREPL